MTKKEKILMEVLLTKVEMLQEDIKEIRQILPSVRERVTALEKMLVFFKGAAAVVSVALGVAANYAYKMYGG